jgi:hypothetical protein
LGTRGKENQIKNKQTQTTKQMSNMDPTKKPWVNTDTRGDQKQEFFFQFSLSQMTFFSVVPS